MNLEKSVGPIVDDNPSFGYSSTISIGKTINDYIEINHTSKDECQELTNQIMALPNIMKFLNYLANQRNESPLTQEAQALLRKSESL